MSLLTTLLTNVGNFTKVIIGDSGVEGSGIDIAGVNYESTFKVSDIDGTNYAQTILHRHSTTLEPLILGARSNSDTSAHSDITAGQNVFNIYGAGYAGSNYKLFGSMAIAADDTGTISNTSAPGKLVRSVTPDGSVIPVAFETVSNDGTIDRADKVTRKVELKDYSETVKDITAAATTDLDIEDGNVFNMTQDTDITTMTFSNPAASGRSTSFTLIRTKDATGTARTIAWPASVKWHVGVAPALSSSASAIDVFSFMTIDGGTTWLGFIGGQGFA